MKKEEWVYKTAEGIPLIRKVVYVKDGEKKSFLNSYKSGEWIRGISTRRVPYGLPEMGVYNDVLIVDNEDCISEVQSVFDTFMVTTWPGDIGDGKLCDWSLISDKNIIVFPSNNKKSLINADKISSALSKKNKVALIKLEEAEKPVNWTISDGLIDGTFSNSEDFKQFISDYNQIIGTGKDMVLDSRPANREVMLGNVASELGSMGISTSGNRVTGNYSDLVKLIGEEAKGEDQMAFFEDEFKMRREVLVGNDFEVFEKRHIVLLINRVQNRFPGFKFPTKENWLDALELAILKTDSAVNRITKELPEWDGTERVEHLFCKYFGAGDTELNRYYSKAVMAGHIGRALAKDGYYANSYKFDSMIVLVGEQGTGKSLGIKTLASDEFYHAPAASDSLDNKDTILNMRGALMVELQEMRLMSRIGEKAKKEFVSAETDKVRPPYGRDAREYNRRFIFWGTTNDPQFLSDCSGERRYWGIHTGKVDIDMIEEDRDQLWAEAFKIYNENPNAKWSELDGALTAAKADVDSDFQADVPWADEIIGYAVKMYTSNSSKVVHVGPDGVSRVYIVIDRILDTLGIEKEKRNAGMRRSVRKSIGMLGFNQPIRVYIDSPISGTRRMQVPSMTEEKFKALYITKEAEANRDAHDEF